VGTEPRKHFPSIPVFPLQNAFAVSYKSKRNRLKNKIKNENENIIKKKKEKRGGRSFVLARGDRGTEALPFHSRFSFTKRFCRILQK
jgi:hypothetical protein